MTPSREHLLELDKETLVDLLAQQQARIAQLEARLFSLEARLSQNSQNSSKPPSSDPPFLPRTPKTLSARSKRSKRKSGGQPGHDGHDGHGLKQVSPPARVQQHFPAACHHCGFPLEEEPAQLAASWQVFDLPADLSIEVVEHQRFGVCCPWCHQNNLSPLPAWLAEETPCQYGPRCRALAVYLMQQQHLPYQRTQALFADLFGSAPSEGSLFLWLRQAYEQLEAVEAAIAEALVAAPQAGADETPARGAGWLHCLVNEDFTWYGAHKKRGREAMDAFDLLPRFQGLLMSDCLASYTIYGQARALCCAHLLRDLQAVSEAGHRWSSQMRRLLLDAKETVAAKGAPLARSRLHALYRRWGKVLALAQRENDARLVDKSFCLMARLEAYRDAYLRFATRADAWFDNNISERALRMMKLHIKVSGCFRSSLGCQILCRVRGYLSTMHKQGQPLLAALRTVMERRPMLPPLLAAQKN